MMKIESETIHMQVDIEIGVRRQEVFEFWRDIKNFPHFMAHVKEVRATNNGRSFWRVGGPAGIDFNWEADIVDIVEGHKFGWLTVPDAQVASTGTVEFVEKGEAKTQVVVSLSYAPPAGAMGHSLATLVGLNPEQQLQAGLARCKDLLEPDGAEKPVGCAVSRSASR